jgi:hypothetical protein
VAGPRRQTRKDLLKPVHLLLLRLQEEVDPLHDLAHGLLQ